MKARLPATVVALGVTSLLTDIGSEMVFPLLPALLLSLGAGPAFLGLIEGVADATASGLKLGFGEISDRSPRKKPFVLFGYGVAGLVRPLVALATAPWHVLAVRVIDRVGKGVRTAPRDVLIAGSVPPEQTGRAFGFHRAMDHAGAVIGPLLATGLLAAGLSLRELFLVTLVPGVLAVLAVATIREAPAPAPAPAKLPAGPKPLVPAALKRYLGVLLIFSLGNSSDAFLLVRAGELGITGAELPLLWAAFHVVKLCSSWLGGNAADRVDKRRLVVAGWAIYGVTYLAFGLATQAWQIWALFLVYGSYYGLTEPAEKALVKELAPAEARGRAYGLYHLVIGASAVPAGLLTGGLWQAFGPLVALGTGAALSALSSLLLLLTLRPARGAPESE